MDTKMARNRHGNGAQSKNRPDAKGRLGCGRLFIAFSGPRGNGLQDSLARTWNPP